MAKQERKKRKGGKEKKKGKAELTSYCGRRHIKRLKKKVEKRLLCVCLRHARKKKKKNVDPTCQFIRPALVFFLSLRFFPLLFLSFFSFLFSYPLLHFTFLLSTPSLHDTRTSSHTSTVNSHLFIRLSL